MIASVTVANIGDAVKLLASAHRFDTVISLYDAAYSSDLDDLRVDGLTHHRFLFCDIDEPDIAKFCGTPVPMPKSAFDSYLEGSQFAGYQGPSFKDVLSIIGLGRDLAANAENHNILVHCSGGYRRSPAVALLLHFLSGKTFDESIRLLLSTNSSIWPNQLILRIADTILEPQVPLYNSIMEWKGRQQGLTLVP
jgi:hypothetical protein